VNVLRIVLIAILVSSLYGAEPEPGPPYETTIAVLHTAPWCVPCRAAHKCFAEAGYEVQESLPDSRPIPCLDVYAGATRYTYIGLPQIKAILRHWKECSDPPKADAVITLQVKTKP